MRGECLGTAVTSAALETHSESITVGEIENEMTKHVCVRVCVETEGMCGYNN